jgi:cholesterol transport system auxiliary component
MNRSIQWRVVLVAIALGGTLAACTGLAPPAVDEISIYVLDARPAIGGLPLQPGVILAVGTPRAWPGFDSPRMAYVKQPHELEYFTKSRWADAPARMLAPVLVRALEQGGSFGAVVHNPGAVAGTLRLDTELVRLQHEFQAPQSRVRVTLRAQLVDMQERRIIGAREFEEVEEAAAENAYAGVAALNRALERLLARLAEFCASAVASR